MTNDPSKTLPAVDSMRALWAVTSPLMGGTKAMRDAGEALLPRYPAEEEKTYAARLKVSTLLPAYAETVKNNTSRVFAEPMQLGEDVPPELATLCEDIDRNGNNVNTWAASVFPIGLSQGLVHAWVEAPRAEGVRTMADEKAAGIRPYVVLVRPEQVLGWRSEAGELTQVRYIESVEEDDGEFGISTVQQIRVLEPGKWRTFRKKEKGSEWVLHEEGVNSLSYIPWATFYTGRTGILTAVPPLLELAYQNVKHWQSQSDQDNLLHVARVPLLFVFTDDEAFQLTISSGSATKMPLDGKAEYVEHTGAAIDAGRQSLLDLIEEMRMTGAKLLQKDKQQQKTATQAGEEAAQELSPLQRMSNAFADFMANILWFMADYKGLKTGGSVEMRGNFDIDFAPEVSLPQLVAMANAGKLSDETLFSEMQRRGVVSDELTWEEEKTRIESQGPALGDLTDPPTGNNANGQ